MPNPECWIQDVFQRRQCFLHVVIRYDGSDYIPPRQEKCKHHISWRQQLNAEARIIWCNSVQVKEMIKNKVHLQLILTFNKTHITSHKWLTKSWYFSCLLLRCVWKICNIKSYHFSNHGIMCILTPQCQITKS